MAQNKIITLAQLSKYDELLKQYLGGQLEAIDGRIDGIDERFDSYIPTSEKGSANGVATLDANIKLPAAQLPVGTVVDSNYTARMSILEGKVTAWDGAVDKQHEHANKALLDTYTQTEADLADAVAKKHEHSNKDILDAITVAFTDANYVHTDNNYDSAAVAEVAKIANKANAADVYTKDEIDNRGYATQSQLHSHSNKDVLDGITEPRVTAWDNAEGNAKLYAEQQVSALKTELLGPGATEALDTIHELATALEEHADEYDALLQVVGSKADAEVVDTVVEDLHLVKAATGFSAWEENPVPTSGYCEYVSINKQLSPNFVKSIIEKEISFADSDVLYVAYVDENNWVGIKKDSYGSFQIVDAKDNVYFHGSTNSGAEWVGELDYIHIDGELQSEVNGVPVGVYNEQLSNVFSINPDTFSQGLFTTRDDLEMVTRSLKDNIQDWVQDQGYLTENDLPEITHPVTSVNEKTGDVVLTGEDITVGGSVEGLKDSTVEGALAGLTQRLEETALSIPSTEDLDGRYVKLTSSEDQSIQSDLLIEGSLYAGYGVTTSSLNLTEGSSTLSLTCKDYELTVNQKPVALREELNDYAKADEYLPLTGGEMTGAIRVDAEAGNVVEISDSSVVVQAVSEDSSISTEVMLSSFEITVTDNNSDDNIKINLEEGIAVNGTGTIKINEKEVATQDWVAGQNFATKEEVGQLPKENSWRHVAVDGTEIADNQVSSSAGINFVSGDGIKLSTSDVTGVVGYADNINVELDNEYLDGKYLQLTGGTVTGLTTFNSSVHFEHDIVITDANTDQLILSSEEGRLDYDGSKIAFLSDIPTVEYATDDEIAALFA